MNISIQLYRKGISEHFSGGFWNNNPGNIDFNQESMFLYQDQESTTPQEKAQTYDHEIL